MKRTRGTKASKALDRLIEATECRDCSVVVTRMDFAKILGKFTKVKIQYENSNSPKTKPEPKSPNSRLRSNENGMVHIPRKTYSRHPVKELLSPRKPRQSSPKTPISVTTRRGQNNNILKENNRLKKTPAAKEKDKTVKVPTKKQINAALKQYGIIFEKPKVKKIVEPKNKISLLDLLPNVDKNILPSEEWSIDYLPYTDEPKVDKVYDRIAAELEDLMYSDKSVPSSDNKTDSGENKSDDFPSILDILNDNTPSSNIKDAPKEEEPQTTLESSEVGTLLAEEPETKKSEDQSDKAPDTATNDVSIEAPASPSILDEALQKGIAEHLPDKIEVIPDTEKKSSASVQPEAMDVDTVSSQNKVEIDLKAPAKDITHLVFKQMKNGSCYKSVTCPKGLKYVIEFAGKSVELLGAPKNVMSRDDLKVLLQIVNESELESPYILH